MTLDAVEFLRRFLLHVLPAGLVRIRQFGLLANRVRKHNLELCRALLAAPFPTAGDGDRANAHLEDLQRCPICKLGRLLVIEFVCRIALGTPDTSSPLRPSCTLSRGMTPMRA